VNEESQTKKKQCSSLASRKINRYLIFVKKKNKNKKIKAVKWRSRRD
jgi:hypothetical protein